MKIDLKVVDLTVGMAGALVSKLLGELGATIHRIEPPDGDPFQNVYPAYRFWHQHAARESSDRLNDLLADADICLLGGEAFPELKWSFSAAELSRTHQRLIVLELAGYLGNPVSKHPAVDILVQARTGLVWEQYTERPVAWALPAPTYGAALHAQIGIWAALVERESSGLGQIVKTSLQQGAAMWWAPSWMTAEKFDPTFDAGNVPKDVRQLIFRCADGEFIQLTLGVPNALPKLYGILGINIEVKPSEARGVPDLTRGVRDFFAPDTDLLETHVALRDHRPLLEALWAAGLAAEVVWPPGACWDDEQARQNGIIATTEDGWRHVANPLHFIKVPPAAVNQKHTERDKTSSESSRDAAPLNGVRIVDLGMIVAGPYTSKILAGLGANVIKVESPAGDINRFCYRSFASANQGKKLIGVDAKSEAGMAILRRLCATADAVQSNFRPGVARRLGLDPENLRELRPDLATLETSGYGSVGPKAQNSGLDMVMQAFCGIEVGAGGEGNAPVWMSSPVVDYATGALGAVALLVGLYQQKRHGVATQAEVNLFDTGIFLISELAQSPDQEFLGAPATGREQLGMHPAERLYRAADGWIAVAARSEPMAQNLAVFAGLDGARLRGQWADEEAGRIAQKISGYLLDDLVHIFREIEVWAEPCVANGWDRLREDRDAVENGLVLSYPDPVYGAVDCTGFNVSFSRSRLDPSALGAAPRMGQDTSEILLALGYGADEIADFFRVKAVS